MVFQFSTSELAVGVGVVSAYCAMAQIASATAGECLAGLGVMAMFALVNVALSDRGRGGKIPAIWNMVATFATSTIAIAIAFLGSYSFLYLENGGYLPVQSPLDQTMLNSIPATLENWYRSLTVSANYLQSYAGMSCISFILLTYPALCYRRYVTPFWSSLPGTLLAIWLVAGV